MSNVSLDNVLLGLLAQKQAPSVSLPSSSSTNSVNTSSDFANLLASALMNDSSSSMLNGLSGTDTSGTDSGSLTGGLTSNSLSSNNLLWDLLASTLTQPANGTNSASNSVPAGTGNIPNLSNPIL